MNAKTKNLFNSLRSELVAAIDSGYFNELPADNYGITPATRLQWAIDSVDYIVGVGDSLGRDVQADDIVSACCVIEDFSKDQYVTEGRGNIQVALDLLASKPEAAVVERSVVTADVADEPDDESDESESLWDKAKKGFNKVAGKKKGAKKDTKKADYEKLKADYDKLKAEKADSDARADAAEVRINLLVSNVKRLEELLDQNGIKH